MDRMSYTVCPPSTAMEAPKREHGTSGFQKGEAERFRGARKGNSFVIVDGDWIVAIGSYSGSFRAKPLEPISQFRPPRSLIRELADEHCKGFNVASDP